MELFPTSTKDIFRRRIIREGEFDGIESKESSQWWLLRWEGVKKQGTDNEAALEKEMEDTLRLVNSFLQQLKVKIILNSKRNTATFREWSKNQEFEHQLKDQVVLGHTLMNKMKELLDLEEYGFRLSGSKGTLYNNSFATINTNSMDEEFEDAVSTCSRYGNEIKHVMRQLGNILNNRMIAIPSREPKLNDVIKTELLQANKSRDALQFLTERLASDNIQPIFQTFPPKESDPSHCTAICKLFNITVEGKSSERVAAKKAAAVAMLERLVNDHLKQTLPPQINPFLDTEMKEAISILCETETYDTMLEELCKDLHKATPRYQADYSRHLVSITCSALGLQGIGTDKNAVVAKRAAARDVLLQHKEKPKY